MRTTLMVRFRKFGLLALALLVSVTLLAVPVSAGTVLPVPDSHVMIGTVPLPEIPMPWWSFHWSFLFYF